MNLTWWCSGGSGQPWDWTYRPYLGVWLLAGLVGALYAWAHRGLAAVAPRPLDRSRTIRLATGIAVLVFASDWPLGPLGAGYSATVSMVRLILYSLVAAPLLVSSVPPWMLRRLIRPKAVFSVVRFLTRWPVAFALFNLTLLLVSTPLAVDALKTTQLGSFALDAVLLAVSLIAWYPVFGQLEELPRLGDPGRSFYVLAQSVVPIIPGSFLAFARFPLFRIYELAPPFMAGFDPVADQQIAGLAINVIGGLILLGYAAVLLLKWANEEDKRPLAQVLGTNGAVHQGPEQSNAGPGSRKTR